ncbi:MAG: dephospho-CoA kinase [Thermoanaerobaculia bacterium]
MALRIGLTGGLGSGKSTVAARLRERGIPVLDADRIVHHLYEPGHEGARAVARSFGPEFLTAEGTVDRAKLALHVFQDGAELKRLNALVHPLVIDVQARWFTNLESEGALLGVIEATLLVESGGRERYDLLITVSAPEELRLQRAAARTHGVRVDDLRGRIAGQLPDEQREAVADVVIRNAGTLEELLEQADRLAATLLGFAEKHAATQPS